MDFLVYCRDRPGSGALRDELIEEHWTYMDRFADRMVARGPTLSADGENATGSLHIVDLPDVAAAQAFVHDEPNWRAGVYAGEALVHRWRNALGRTMWEFTSDRSDDERFFVIGHGRDQAGRDALEGSHRDYLASNGYDERVIVSGALLDDDGAGWLGDAFCVELPAMAAAEAMIAGDPVARAGLYERVEIHPWTFGGRR